MLKRFTTVLLTVLAMLAAMLPGAMASPAYSGPYFGEGNFPPGCEGDMAAGPVWLTQPANTVCHHMRTDMNGLDSPQIDVLVMVPVSPTAERDMRIMRQSIEMWEGGLEYLATQMGLDWLANGVDFHLTVDFFDPTGNGGEFTTYPIVDPEIVVIASNPVGGIGIGIDPVDFVFTNEDLVPCHNVQNPFDFEYWENLPGFDSHHEARSGTYTEDCNGAGGNICFAINGAIDPAPGAIDFFGLFDLVSHEFGHCLTIGHVGDGAEGDWGGLPTNDIMAYHSDPPGLTKCVSTLDVEGFATQMSKYIDVNGDGTVDGEDRRLANDQVGDGGNPFQVQHPDDHFYASSTGSAMDCPQPDLAAVPGPRTNWTPTAVDTGNAVLTVTGPDEGAINDDGIFDVTGTVEHVATDNDPTDPFGAYDDADDDATTPVTEILDLDVLVTETHVEATISLADLWPTADATTPTSYSVTIDGRQFDSFVRYAVVDSNPMTWDNDAGAYMPAGTSSWDVAAKTVSFSIPRDYLANATITAPYYVGSAANFGFLTNTVVDDTAPDAGGTVGVASARIVEVGTPDIGVADNTETVTFEHADGNTFFPEQSSLGIVPTEAAHAFNLDVAKTSEVEFTLTWTDTIGGTDLDLYVTGAADSGSEGASADPTETFILTDVLGSLNIDVEPYLVTDAIDGTTYTLTATITPTDLGPDSDGDGILDADDQCPAESGPAPTGCPIVDTDGDGVADADDVCPNVAGNGADGCPIGATEQVHVYVDGVLAASQDVDTTNGADTFSIPVELAEGDHVLLIEWRDTGKIEATATRTVTHNTDDDADGVANADDVCPGFDDTVDSDGDGIPDGCDAVADRDRDGDGVADYVDNCSQVANADQSDIDGDGSGDACDSDMDGDGHSNAKEEKAGTDPADPTSFPVKGKGGKK